MSKINTDSKERSAKHGTTRRTARQAEFKIRVKLPVGQENVAVVTIRQSAESKTK
jgi:hypothetical protein